MSDAHDRKGYVFLRGRPTAVLSFSRVMIDSAELVDVALPTCFRLGHCPLGISWAEPSRSVI